MENSNVVQKRKLQLSKLQGLREHLSALLAKRARLDLEIKELRKTYKKRKTEITNSQKAFKVSLSLEAVGAQSLEEQHALQQEVDILDGQIAQEMLSITELLDNELTQKETINLFLSWLQELEIQD